MILELTNKLYEKIKKCVGDSAVVHSIAEEFAQSGITAEEANILVKYTGSERTNPNEGAYISTVRERTVNYAIEISYQSSQRSGHSFALGFIDEIDSCLSGWVPECMELSFMTGFEVRKDYYKELTNASQYIYVIEVSVRIRLEDGQTNSLPCNILNCSFNLSDILPCKRCVKTREGRNIGVALWENCKNIGENVYVVDTENCKLENGDTFTYTCVTKFPSLSGEANYTFTPNGGNAQTGQLKKFWPCMNPKNEERPTTCRPLNISASIWKKVNGQSIKSPSTFVQTVKLTS